MRSLRPFVVMVLWISVCLSLVLFASHWAGGCRSSVPVIVKQVNYQCSNIVDNGDGTVTLEQCREDGRINQEAAPGGAGDENLYFEGSQTAGPKDEGTTSPRLSVNRTGQYRTTPDFSSSSRHRKN